MVLTLQEISWRTSDCQYTIRRTLLQWYGEVPKKTATESVAVSEHNAYHRNGADDDTSSYFINIIFRTSDLPPEESRAT